MSILMMPGEINAKPVAGFFNAAAYKFPFPAVLSITLGTALAPYEADGRVFTGWRGGIWMRGSVAIAMCGRVGRMPVVALANDTLPATSTPPVIR